LRWVAIAPIANSNAQDKQLNSRDADHQHCERNLIVFKPMPNLRKHDVRLRWSAAFFLGSKTRPADRMTM
jgi:hypothetical protein